MIENLYPEYIKNSLNWVKKIKKTKPNQTQTKLSISNVMEQLELSDCQ